MKALTQAQRNTLQAVHSRQLRGGPVPSWYYKQNVVNALIRRGLLAEKGGNLSVTEPKDKK